MNSAIETGFAAFIATFGGLVITLFVLCTSDADRLLGSIVALFVSSVVAFIVGGIANAVHEYRAYSRFLSGEERCWNDRCSCWFPYSR